MVGPTYWRQEGAVHESLQLKKRRQERPAVLLLLAEVQGNYPLTLACSLSGIRSSSMSCVEEEEEGTPV